MTRLRIVSALTLSLLAASAGCSDSGGGAAAPSTGAPAQGTDAGTAPVGAPPGPPNDVSPTRRMENPPPGDRVRDPARPPAPRPPTGTAEARSIDGSGNNLADPAMGAAGTALRRLVPAAYADGVSAMAGPGRPGPREVSNAVCAQGGSIPNPLGASDWLWQWGQFLDHDLDLTEGADPPEPAPIAIPAGDPFFDPQGTGTQTMRFNRSLSDPASGTGPGNPRLQVNEITAWIDASMVYGSDAARARSLRTLDGTGRLRTSAGGLLPFNAPSLPNSGGAAPTSFLAGDVRVNEQVGLIAVHTLFMREHNRKAAEIAARDPGLSDDEIYERARRFVGALVQAISTREFLPALLGPGALPAYRGYDPSVDARISTIFSTASYRFGHSALSPRILRLDASLAEIPAGHLPLRSAFFGTAAVISDGIDPILRGLAIGRAQRVDALIIDDVRNFLFGPPGAGGFDLASLNIQRGRDHGLPGYNEAREALGLPRRATFSEMTSDPTVRARLASVYADPDEVDVWLGGLCEDPLPGAHVGPLVARVLREQFTALRDGDRFWYERALPPEVRDEVSRTRLSDVIRRNTGIGREIPDDVFRSPR
jgi:hypothetical protein